MHNYISSYTLWSTSVICTGSLLFLDFIDDLFKCPISTTPTLYADDNCLILSRKNLIELEMKANLDQHFIYNWITKSKIAFEIKMHFDISQIKQKPIAHSTFI